MQVTIGWRTNKCEWHTDDIWVHTSDIQWHKSTYEWCTGDIQVHTNDMRMTYNYTRVTYRWHTSTYEWHTNGIWVHTSEIRMRYNYLYCFGLFTKIKKVFGINFQCIFSAWIFHANASYFILYHVSTLYPFKRYQTKCVVKFWFIQLMTSLTLSFFFNNSLKKWPSEGEWGKSEMQKFEYLENKKNFL